MLTNTKLYLHTPLAPHLTTAIHLGNRDYKAWRRRRLKQSRRKASVLAVRCQLGNPLQSPFDSLVSSVASLDLVAPALGLASGLALYLSNRNLRLRESWIGQRGVDDVGEWILFTSPTPFNRFVVLRCPSIELEREVGGEKLVEEDRHYVRLRRGRTGEMEMESVVEEERVVYQRKCVLTDDGGVISLDWPANLEMSDEHGLDTTIVIVAGTSEGSMEENVKLFVVECVRRGCFPVVVNPRGCSGSPLTTARLFTAADSDDVSTAIQFINKERPWTTLMGVGWGYGANMLTKYLAEVGDNTPLTAATCVDNPFDLEAASRSFSYDRAIDQKFTRGLVDILKSNKELFQGRGKDFDIEGALQATCVRDFEKAVSMISYGFDAIEDFYSTSSTQGLVDKVKIPLLFVQNDDGKVPIFSIPHSSIAENPYTSLLLCSSPPSNTTTSGISTIAWCRHLTIEWLTAVELGLLKGRHPLLKDVDINISKGLLTVESKVIKKSGQVKKIPSLPRIGNVNVNGSSVTNFKEVSGGRDVAVGLHIRTERDSLRSSQDEHVGPKHENNDVINQGTPVIADPPEDGVIPEDSERGQVLQTAEIVMNMLDVTMPNTLTEEKKKKVLNAVGKGETLMQALQEAVPEDVREKLTTSVSGIMQNRGSNLNFGSLLNIGHIPDMASGLDSKIQGKILSPVGKADDSHSSKQKMMGKDLADDGNESQAGVDKPVGDPNSESHAVDSFQETADTDQLQTGDIGAEVSVSGNSITNEQGSDTKTKESSNENGAQDTKQKENTLKANSGLELSVGSDMSNSTGDQTLDQSKLSQDTESYKSDIKEDKSKQQNGDSNALLPSNENKLTLDEKEGTLATPTPEAESAEKENTENQKREEKVMDPNQNSSSTPTFSVSQAFDAFTGIDDSTQAAVNSVFNVIEGMITHLEEERDDGTEVENGKESSDKETGSVSEKNGTSDNKLGRKQENQPDSTLQFKKLDDVSLCDNMDARNNLAEQPSHMPATFDDNGVHQLQEINSAFHVDKANELNEKLVGTRHSDKVRSVEKVPHDIPRRISKSPIGDPLYSERLRKCLTSQMDNAKLLDLDTTAALFLDYYPEEGQWKLLEQSGHAKDSFDDATLEGMDTSIQNNISLKEGHIIEPSYVILDSEKLHEPVEECEMANSMNEIAEMCDATSKEQMRNVKTVVIDSLMLEVSRRLTSADIKEMEADLVSDLEHVSKAASLALRFGKDRIPYIEDADHTSDEVNTLLGEYIVRAISLAVQDTSYLRKVLPLGVVVGSSLAALRNHFDAPSATKNRQRDVIRDKINFSRAENRVETFERETVGMPSDSFDNNELEKPSRKNEARDKSSDGNNGSAMVGAVTAALGASALLVHQQDCGDDEISETSSNLLKKEDNHHKLGKFVEESSEKNETNIVTSLAEKAMSVAGPVVPTKDGGLDQGRLVAMLAEFGQRGGMLRLVGKAALLWGGIRGALSLIERLISFLRFADRPLFQRILGFICLVLVLWTPVAVPLLPTIVQGWASHSSTEFAELACIIGLYVSIMTLIILWGKRIRGYENPLKQYGLDLTSSQVIKNYLYGLAGGVFFVLAINSVSALIGLVHLSWPSNVSSASDAANQLKFYVQLLLLCGKGLATATGVALVEELLFRSWLPNEIAIDLGYYRGIIISGLAFSLSQRSLLAIPGLWLLSLCLSGARQRCQGSLSLPIGIRTGIMASCFILKTGGFLTYEPNFPIWLTGTLSFEPFSGIVGLAFTLLLTVVLYPRRQPITGNKVARRARE
ncbi:hypothetical protein ACET3Z_028086 [Daucus carota]